MECPKCHASRASLEPIAEHLEDGTILQTVRCIRCGERRSRGVGNQWVQNPQREEVPA